MVMNIIIIFTKKGLSNEKRIKNETIIFIKKIMNKLKICIVNF